MSSSSAPPSQALPDADLGHVLQQATESYFRHDWDRAAALCQQILQANPAQFDALHLLGSMQIQRSQFQEAFEVLSRAALVQPANPTIENKLGIVCTQLKHEAPALAHFENALNADPKFAEAYVGRAALHESLGRVQAAMADYRAAVDLRPDFAMAHLLLGHCLVQVGEAEAGIESYDRVLALVPGLPDALHAKGNALRGLGRHELAVSSYERALRSDANHLASLASLADLLAELERHEAALPLLVRLLQLQPQHVDALLLRGRVRFKCGQFNEAEQDFQAVLGLSPSTHGARIGLGAIHIKRRNFADAVSTFRQVLDMGGEQEVDAYLGLSQALRAMGLVDEAAPLIEQAAELAPDSALVWYNRADLQINHRQLEAAVASLQRACEIKPDYAELLTNLLFIQNFLPAVSPEEHLAAARLWNERHAVPVQGAAFVHTRPAPGRRRLRLGYVSSDFREHAVAKFMAPVLAKHDRKQFDLLGYHCSPFRDDVTHALAKSFKQFRNSDRLSPEALARQIHDDGVDILVDLSGHTDGNRLLAFARRPAPVQITYLGYPGTTGLSTMDFRITDIHADPVGGPLPYTETLLRLPQSMWCYQPGPAMPRVGPLPALERGHLTLGSFNSFTKVDQRSLALWAKLLHALPDARLVVATLPQGSVREEILRELASLGIDAQRIELLGHLKSAEFYQRLERVDISLDPVSVNGATTTCESLWLGVPVLTRVGNRFLERAGLSILSAAGLTEFCCESDEACVQLLQALAADLPRLATLRAGLRAALLKSPLMDAPTFTRALEGLYLEAWRRWASPADAAR